MKVLALDFGLKRVGIAVADTETGIAFTRPVVINDDHFFDLLKALIDREGIEHILIGNPLTTRGDAGSIEPEIQELVSQLKGVGSFGIELYDERYTSRIAQQKKQELGLNKTEREKKGRLDSLAAQVLLQDWLDHHSFLP